MKILIVFVLSITFTSTLPAQNKTIGQRVDSVLSLMTLEEKVGQLNQYSGDWISTGPITNDGDKQNQIRRGADWKYAQYYGHTPHAIVAGNGDGVTIEDPAFVWAGCDSWV
ncbi:MAG: hypothetical protein NVV59_18565 [Chitinophagaceae bacterium]|nr:hypothetical protein [Chitinophagaceae bacterium]